MATIADQARGTRVMSRDAPDAPEWQLLGCFGKECQPDQLAAASPVAYVDRDDPPILLIVGTDGTLVPHQQTLEMADRLKAAGAQHELVVLPAVGHSLIGKTQQETREANLKALAATFRFIDQTTTNTAVTSR